MREQQEISFLVDKQELKLLNEIIIVDEEIDDSLERAKLKGDKYRLKFSYDAIEELLGFLAAASNHEKSERKQERLDKLSDRVEKLIKLSELVKTHGKTKMLKKKPAVKGKVHIFDIWISDSKKAPHKPLRKIGISGAKSLYNFAGVIVKAFGFYFDHCFGFYSNIVSRNDSSIGYELFADIGEEQLRPHFKGVKKTKISEAFSTVGTKMLFFFDYGDAWHFIVELKEVRDALPGESLPVLLESIGRAPIQYPPCEMRFRRKLS